MSITFRPTARGRLWTRISTPPNAGRCSASVPAASSRHTSMQASARDSGRAAAVRLRASVGTGFKEPTFYENFARGFVTGNPSLDPERSRSWEAGIERGGIAVAYFNQRFRDLIEYNPAPPAGQPNYFNVDGAVAGGLEIEGEGARARAA